MKNLKVVLVQKRSKKTGNLYFAWKVEFKYGDRVMVKYYPFFEYDLYLSQLYNEESYKEFE